VLGDQKGSIMVIFALVLTVLLGMVALGIEAGSWYAVRAELSKAVDAAALEGAKNISNPYVNPVELAKQIGEANFSTGYLGTSKTEGSVSFTASLDQGNSTISVAATASAVGIFSRLFGVGSVTVASVGAARKTDVDIMLVLDRSGSMGNGNGRGGTKLDDLKAAALGFLAFFKDTEDADRIGLISFSQNVTVDFPLDNDFYSGVTNVINGLTANGNTNIEDALAQSIQDKGFQSGGQRKQFLLLFTDGVPNALRGDFWTQGTRYDGVVKCSDNLCAWGISPDLFDPTSGADLGVDATPVGDGTGATTRWGVFDAYPRSGRTLNAYVSQTSKDMSVRNAKNIKDQGVTIYVVGLGTEGASDYDKNLLVTISSGESAFYYNTPDSGKLSSIFQAIAKDIKLRLVQ
jgi:Flp pilus assembly protein TadG